MTRDAAFPRILCFVAVLNKYWKTSVGFLTTGNRRIRDIIPKSPWSYIPCSINVLHRVTKPNSVGLIVIANRIEGV